MNIREKLFYAIALSVVMTVGLVQPARAQLDLSPDTLECHIIGFNVGPVFPSTAFSAETSPSGTVSHNATMASLYKGPSWGLGWMCCISTSRDGW